MIEMREKISCTNNKGEKGKWKQKRTKKEKIKQELRHVEYF